MAIKRNLCDGELTGMHRGKYMRVLLKDIQSSSVSQEIPFRSVQKRLFRSTLLGVFKDTTWRAFLQTSTDNVANRQSYRPIRRKVY
jgi:hypothetical protein